MENRAHALAAGLFTLFLAVALVAAGLWFRRDDIRFAQYIVTTSGSVTGLRLEAPVRYRGVDVGRVESIRIGPAAFGRIDVRIGVQEDTPITRSTYAQLGYQGVTGLAYVSLDDDGSSSERLKPGDGEPPRIEMRPSVFDSGMDLVAAVKELSGRMNELLNEENRKLVTRVLKQTAALAEQLQGGARDVPALVADARVSLADVSKLARKIEERSVALDRMAAGVEELGAASRSFSDETLPRVNTLVEQLQRDSRALERVISTLGENPQSFVFGAQRGRPGPGESGFKDGSR